MNTKYERAQKRMENLKAFYIHLMVYFLVNTFFIIINILNYEESGHWWFIYPLFGWGIGLASHGISAGSFGLFGPKWEEKKIQEFMDRDKKDDE